jgi:DNA-binding NtrC family response regulator
MSADGTFRSDLLYRIRSFHIETPPLRKRLEDVQALTEFYISRLCTRKEITVKGLSSEFLDYLSLYNWPGNVRELFNTLDRAMMEAGSSPMLFGKHLPVELRVKVATSSFVHEKEVNTSVQEASNGIGKFHEAREMVIAKMEYDYLSKLVLLSGGDVKKACDHSGLSRSRFYELVKKYSIKC